MGCQEIRIVGCGERYGMWAVETVERDKEHGLQRLWREITNVGCGERYGMWAVDSVERDKEHGL